MKPKKLADDSGLGPDRRSRRTVKVAAFITEGFTEEAEKRSIADLIASYDPRIGRTCGA